MPIMIRKKKTYQPELLPQVKKPKVDTTPKDTKGGEQEAVPQLIIQFSDPDGVSSGPQLDVPAALTKAQLEALLNQLLENEEEQPYSFTLNENAVEITSTLQESFDLAKLSSEQVLRITYYPLAVFRVRPVTRCTASMEGHSDAVLAVAFSPDGQSLASGSGDTTVRIWNLMMEAPQHTCKGHSNWVLAVAWAPDGSALASAGMDHSVRTWDPKTGKPLGPVLQGHSKPVTFISWQPLHLASRATSSAVEGAYSRLASCSKDCSIRVWDVMMGLSLYVLTSHTQPVMCVKWSGEGEGYLYSASRDRTIKVWNPENGKMIKELQGHGHWVNHLALNTDHVLKTGPYDHTGAKDFGSWEEKKAAAKERYDAAIKALGGEKMLSASDDFSMFLWTRTESRKPVCRLTGHQKTVNHVAFSPDGRMIASASFDKSIRLWDGRTGKFIAALRGHVGDVHQVCWSADSRMLVSGSKDSTVKVWDVIKRKLKEDLPGHADEVYAIDWSPEGARVASGAKDRILKIWRH